MPSSHWINSRPLPAPPRSSLGAPNEVLFVPLTWVFAAFPASRA
jgi:hypothetical protein